MANLDFHGKARPHRLRKILFRAFLVFWVVVLIDGYFTRLPIHDPGKRVPGEEVGILHVHTKVNHGGGSPDDVIQAARASNLTFVTITDHNIAFHRGMLKQLPTDVTVVGGEEVSTDDGHLLVLGVQPGWRDDKSHPAEELMQAAGRVNAMRILAHPFGAPRWKHWETTSFDGIEVWNDDVQLRHGGLQLLVTLLMYPVNPELALTRLASRPGTELAKWDELLKSRHIVGTCGADAHEAIPLGGSRLWRFPKYVSVFRISRQHVLLSSASVPAQSAARSPDALLDALRKGHTYCAVDSLAPASGFQEEVTSGSTIAGIGDTARYDPKSLPKLRIVLPSTPSMPLIKIYKDGTEWRSSSQQILETPIFEPGVYRTEVWLRQPGLTGWNRWTPWIIANPIYVEAGKP